MLLILAALIFGLFLAATFQTGAAAFIGTMIPIAVAWFVLANE